jgi:hypothetical protein
MPASQYIHPEFGFFCPAPRLRRRLRVVLACLAMAGVGAAKWPQPSVPSPMPRSHTFMRRPSLRRLRR